jgi:RNA polymerase sigma factor (sigma-70 family)
MGSAHPSTLLRHLHRFAEEHAEQSDGQLLQRFAGQGEEAAFAALLRRHGRLVWSVCRHILDREHDIEDAFQATFLVLARRAAAIRKTEAVASWLHGVAYRVAMSAKKRTARRQQRERRAAAPEAQPAPADPAVRELQAILDEELLRLPPKYRAPFVLCCLEGRSRQETASELGLKEGTVSSRIAQARRLLQQQMIRRGVTLSAALTAGVLWGRSAWASLPATLVQPTVKAALQVVAGQTVSQAAVPSVAALVQGGLKVTATAKMKIATAVLLAATLLGGVSLALGVRSQESAEVASDPPRAEGDRPKTDRFGDPLPDGALARLGTVRWRHGSQVLALAYSSDGKMLASGSIDETVHLWDAKTGRPLRILRGHGAWVDSVFFTPDGKHVISCGQDQTARVWEVATGKELRRWKTRGGWKMALSPDGKSLAGMGEFPEKATIFLWDTATGKKVRELPYEGEQDVAFDLAFSPDGKRLVCAGKALRLFDLATGKQCPVFGKGQRINSVAFSEGGKVLAVGRNGQPVALWDMTTLKEIRRLDGDPEGARALAFAPNGKALAVAAFGPEGRVALWDPATGAKLRDLARKHYQVWNMTFSPSGQTVAVGNLDSIVHLYDAASGKERAASAGGHQERLSFLAFADHDRAILSVSSEGLVRQWDLAMAKAVREFREEGTYGFCGDLSPDGRTLALGGEKGAYLFDWATGKKLRALKGHKLQVFAVAFSPEGARLATAANLDADILLWNEATGKESGRLSTPHMLDQRSLAWSPDRKVLASTGAKGDGGKIVYTICLWDTATGKQLAEWLANEPGTERYGAGVRAMAFSPEGTLLASGGGDRTIALWNVATRTLLTRLHGHPRGVSAVAFSPSGRMLASGGDDGTVRLWELATGKERHRYDGHLGSISRLVFSADGRMLASAGGDTSVLVWSVTGLDPRRRQPEVTLTPGQLEKLWSALAGDAPQAWRAACTLASAPKQTLAWLQEHLAARSPTDPRRIAQLIADLDSGKYPVRQQATRELEKLGERAESALRKFLDGKATAEARRRAEQLLAKMDGLVQSPEVLRGLRAVEVLEQIGTAEARRQLERLAREAPGTRMKKEAKTAAQRLAKGAAR